MWSLLHWLVCYTYSGRLVLCCSTYAHRNISFLVLQVQLQNCMSMCKQLLSGAFWPFHPLLCPFGFHRILRLHFDITMSHGIVCMLFNHLLYKSMAKIHSIYCYLRVHTGAVCLLHFLFPSQLIGPLYPNSLYRALHLYRKTDPLYPSSITFRPLSISGISSMLQPPIPGIKHLKSLYELN